MFLGRSSLLSLTCAAALVLTGCGEDAPEPDTTGSQLAPEFQKDKPQKTKGKKAGEKKAGKAKPAPEAPAATTTPDSEADPGGDAGGDSNAGEPAPAQTRRPAPIKPTASLTDPAGDVRSTLGAPSYVDVVGADLVRADGRFTLKVALNGAPPGALSGGKTMNLASFVDVDGDGRIDYEMWGNLADSGWSGSYRHPDGAKFGRTSGVDVHASGRAVVISFPASHVGGADSFRWSVAAEYGSYEQVASGTTATDYAPNSGAVAFPG